MSADGKIIERSIILTFANKVELTKSPWLYQLVSELRGGIPYGYLLELCDKWPVSVKRRGHGGALTRGVHGRGAQGSTGVWVAIQCLL